jgi:hypothetical protein
MVIVLPFCIFFNTLFPTPFTGTDSGGHWSAVVMITYGLCAVPLLLGLLVQLFVCRREDINQTLFFLVPSVLIVLSFIFNEVQHNRFVESERWKTQTYEMDFDEVVGRVANMEQQSGGKWHWNQKQEDKPSPHINRQFHFAMNEHQTDADLVFLVYLATTETNKTTISEQTLKFGRLGDPNLHEQDLVAETNRIHAVIKAIQGR